MAEICNKRRKRYIGHWCNNGRESRNAATVPWIPRQGQWVQERGATSSEAKKARGCLEKRPCQESLCSKLQNCGAVFKTSLTSFNVHFGIFLTLLTLCCTWETFQKHMPRLLTVMCSSKVLEMHARYTLWIRTPSIWLWYWPLCDPCNCLTDFWLAKNPIISNKPLSQLSLLACIIILFSSSLSDNEIESEGATVLADTLQVNQSLKTLE